MAGVNSEVEALRKQLAERDQRMFALEAKLDMALQLANAKSEPERVEMQDKLAKKAQRDAVKDEALAVAKELSKGKEKVTHLRYVTGGWYHRKGTNYPPGTVLKIPVAEEPAQDWKAWKRPVVTRHGAIDPDAGGVPFAEVRSSTSAIADLRRSELAGDTIVAGRPPPAAEDLSEPQSGSPSAEEQATEPASGTRASDTEVG